MLRRNWIVISILAVFTMFSIIITLAHEGREVEGYNLVFGWRNEPALVGYPNGPELFISLHEHEDEDTDHDHNTEEDEHQDLMAEIDVSLQVEVTFGPATRILELRPAFGETGHYIADLIPTRPGDYSFRVFGSIGDAEIDEIFTSADGSFSSVEPASDITFPDEVSSIVQLLERLDALEARIAELEGGE